MQFLFDGFTQDGNNRCYSFRLVAERQPTALYAIRVDLALFSKYQVSLQSGPVFCLHLLQAACANSTIDPGCSYQVVDADFTAVLEERAARAAALASKKTANRHFRKPQPASQLRRHPS